MSAQRGRAGLPSVDRLLSRPAAAALVDAHGRREALRAVREVLAAARAAYAGSDDAAAAPVDDHDWLLRAEALLNARAQTQPRPVFNLSGIVLHSNLGRARLPESARRAVEAVMREASDLEFDLSTGGRGNRDARAAELVCELTGAEAATLVNNNAAAVLLLLNTLALGREVLVSRGELVEIGGSFRIPDVMTRAGSGLREVGTTNRTHLADFSDALDNESDAALIMKVHASNYAIQGFTKAVPEAELAKLARARGVPFVIDLGSGSLVDLAHWGLPAEPTPMQALAAGADLVTFSGDKLLGGPQCGLIVGRKDLIDQLRGNPLKRALRLDKMTLAALDAVLRLYRDPDRLAEQLPTLRLLTRPADEIRAAAKRVAPALREWLSGRPVSVNLLDCASQIGSGALPVDSLPSAGLAIKPGGTSQKVLHELAAELRLLPVPVIGRIADGALCLDMRCLDDEAAFLRQLDRTR